MIFQGDILINYHTHECIFLFFNVVRMNQIIVTGVFGDAVANIQIIPIFSHTKVRIGVKNQM